MFLTSGRLLLPCCSDLDRETEIRMVSWIKMIFAQILQVYLISRDAQILTVTESQIKMMNVQRLQDRLKTTVVLGQIQMVTEPSTETITVLMFLDQLKTQDAHGQIQTVTLS